MPDIQARGDRSHSAPGEPFEDPFEPAASWRRRLELPVQLAFEDPDAFVEGVVDDVLAMPTERRFAESHAVLRDHVEAEFGSVDAFESRLGMNRSELVGYLVETVEQTLDETLQGVFFHRDAGEHLVVAAALESVRWAMQRAIETESRAERERVAPAAVAAFCRLYSAMTRRESEEVPAALLRDVLETVNVLAGPDETAFDVGEGTTPEELRRMVEVFGAVVAYRDLDISVGRGAELLRCSRSEFEEVLDRFGVEPRYGPASVEELREDSFLDE